MASGQRGLGWFDRLGVRLVLMLGVALLPLGLIAISQTYRMIEEVNARTRSALIGETLDAAASERQLIAGTLTTARALATLSGTLTEDLELCSQMMRALVSETPAVAFAGVAAMDGEVICGSQGVGETLAGTEGFERFAETGSEYVNSVAKGRITGLPVVVVREPILENGEVVGFLAISVLHSALDVEATLFSRSPPRDILTFNARGEVLTSDVGLDTATERLPANRALELLATPEPKFFRGTDASGEERIYTVAPLLHDSAYIMAVWPPERPGIALANASTAIAFPLLMWLASLGVAYFAVHTLVIRYIRDLRRRIRAFSSTRRLMSEPNFRGMPSEMREVTEAFLSMTEQIVRDEADLQNSLHEKDVLLKEVYHRVKNNLQLIASITNMQIRKSKSPETRFILRRLQDRVMGLAAIHRSLYQATALSEVSADRLLKDIADHLSVSVISSRSDIQFDVELEPVTLYPDQAVPLALLLTEAMTNAMKYIGRPDDGGPWIKLQLRRLTDGVVELRVSNSTGTPLKDAHNESTGLGGQLMAAFTMQLGATLQSDTSDGAYVVSARFQPSDFSQAEDAA